MKIHVLIDPVLRITSLDNCLHIDFPHPYYFPGEFHPFWEMVYVTEGTLQAASEENIYTMHKGDIIFHKPMEFHRLWSIDDTDIHALIIGFCAKGSVLSSLENGAFILSSMQEAELNGILQALRATFPEPRQAFLRAMLSSWQENAGEVQKFINRFENFLISLANDPKPLVRKTISDATDSLVYRKIVEELNASLDGWPTIQQLAEKLSFSPAQLHRSFAKYSDIGIHKYLLKLKTASAIQLLQEGRSVNEVSHLLGFSNQNYFSTVFKRETGFSPTHYLQRIRED